ncbi:MAG: hypothetical protein WA996_20585 [Candidatus Promineifilaceae bacterium]
MSITNDKAVRELVKAIHDTPGRVMLVTAGAGTRALAWILGVAGASRTLLEALTPYDESSFDDFLGRRPAKYVVASTAGLLAGRAVVRARHLYRGEEPVIGLACSATIVTDRPKRGQHRAHIAVWTAGTVDRYALYMHKGERDRRGEEEMVSLVIMNALSRAYNIGIELPLPLLEEDRYSRVCNDISGETQKVLDGESDFFGIRADGRLFGRRSAPKAILSGAFNPLHEGHLGLASTATEILGCDVTFELAALNAGKPSLSIDHIKERLLQFAGRSTVLVSNTALFAAKARLYPGATFVVGVDTAQRVLQPRYYDDSLDTMFAAIDTIKERGCGFLVAGRVDERGDYMPAAALEIPDLYSDLFTAIPGDRFRIDLSSTALRDQGAIGSTN